MKPFAWPPVSTATRGCSSCHTDAEDFDMSMCEVDFEGVEYEVCCALANELDRKTKKAAARKELGDG